MRLRKQLVITAEKTETYIISQAPPQVFQTQCPRCEQSIMSLTVDQTVNLTGLGARAIFRLSETGDLHAFETAEGYLRLCPNSVALLVRL